MPVLSSTSVLNTIVNTTTTAASTAPNATSVGNATAADILHVVCAFPVSGQYGPGSRILYYVLIAACLLARKAEWLRNACLAAALLFPAVAALHGIVLASLHLEGAVDMDIYGAFQLCSIGILAAPVTVKLSRTYFYDPGRNTIFAWTALILAGLLSLTVEFFRTNTSPCPYDGSGNPVSPYPGQFSYNTTCGLTCSVDQGPFSPLRQNAANNIYVIPAPDKLTFGTAALLSAACAIPAILSLVSMWSKILEINWKARFGKKDEKEQIDKPIEGTNGATLKRMKGVNSLIRSFLSAVEIPIFGAAVLAILINGERNFWSSQVYYQTEPIASIGQWAPIVGTVLAVIGSLYILLAADLDAAEKEEESDVRKSGQQDSKEAAGLDLGLGLFVGSSLSVANPDANHDRRSVSRDRRGTLSKKKPTSNHEERPDRSPHQGLKRSWTVDGGTGKRREVAKALTAIGNYLGTAASDRFDYSEYRRGEAQDFPEIPGEAHRNEGLRQIREQYNQYRNADGDVTPDIHRQHSTGGSFAGSVTSRNDIDGSSATHVEVSSPQFLSPNNPRRPDNTMPHAFLKPPDPSFSPTLARDRSQHE